MKLLWVIAVWFALLVQPLNCMSFTNNVLSIEKSSNPEKVFIAGLNGLCATVNNSDNHNWNTVVLSECKDGQENQLWTMREDQTIRSGEKCLIAYRHAPGGLVMVYDCTAAIPYTTKWGYVSTLGRFINPETDLSLTAIQDMNGGYFLVVDRFRYVPSQVWRATKDTKPPVHMILGGSLVVTRDGFQRVKMDEIRHISNKDARWAIYPDGTIRPEQDQRRCLRFEYGEYRIGVATCGGWTNEPWIISRPDRTILNLATGLVMDVKWTREPPIRSIPFLNCRDGRPSQSFTLSFPLPPLHASA